VKDASGLRISHSPPRKMWISEDYQMGLFDAVVLAIV
jgi:hypothetical protein